MSTTKYIIDNINGSLQGQNVQGNFSASTFYGDGSQLQGILIEDVTYSGLTNLILTSGLTSGRNYRITDYRTVNLLHGQNIASQNGSPVTLPQGSFDPSFDNFIGFDDGVHAIKEVELGSIYFDGSSNNRVDVEYNPNFLIGTSDFTIEWFQFYEGDRDYNPRAFSIGDYPTAKLAISFETGPQNYFWWNGNGQPYGLNLTKPIDNAWCHFAIVRNSGIITIYQDGVQVYQAEHADDLDLTGQNISIGIQSSNSGPFEGYITNFRWTSGVALYTTGFTPSTKQLKAEPNTVILLNAMSNGKLTRNSCDSIQNVSASNVTWNKKTPFESERKIYVGGYYLSMYNDDFIGGVVRLNQDGTLDKTFNTFGSNYSIERGFSDVIKCIEIQDDGKILVGGNFNRYDDKYCGYIVRLNEDGSQDMDFDTSNDGYGFNNTVRAIVALPDGKILVGGNFDSYEDSDNGTTSVSNICLLENNGFCNQGFSQSSGFYFNGAVYSIRQLNPSSLDTKFYVAGEFTNWNDPFSGSTPANRLIRLNSNWSYDNTFFIENGGFDRRIFDVAIQGDDKVVVVGGNNNGRYTQYTYNGTAFTANSIIRLNSDASVDETFSSGAGFSSFTDTVDLLDDGRIVVGGQFVSYYGTNVSKLAVLNSDGTIDNNFIRTFNPAGQVIKAVKLADGDILCGGWFSDTSLYPGRLGYIAKYITSERPSAFSWSGTNVGAVEPIVVEATSESTLSPIAHSESNPQDIIEYNPYSSKIGYGYDIYNGRTMPDNTTLTGFDLQWDGSRVYFDMPEDYPMTFGRIAQIQATFEYDDLEMSLVINNVIPGVSMVPTNGNYENTSPTIYSKVEISLDGTRVYLTDLTYTTFTGYDPDSLNVTFELPLASSYGCIVRRTDTVQNVSAPFDFRNVKYRRYEMAISNTVFDWDFRFIGLTDNYLGQNTRASGRYHDFLVFGDRGSRFESIDWASSTPYQPAENNVITGDFHNVSITGPFYQNTIINGFFNSNLHSWHENIMNYCHDITTSGEFFNNQFRSGFYKNNVKSGFYQNLAVSDFYTNEIGYDFSANRHKNSFVGNFVSNFCQYNTFDYTVTNRMYNTFMYNSFYNYLNSSEFDYTYNNVFSGQCMNVYIKSPSFSNNNVRVDFKNTVVRGTCSGYDFGNPGHSNDSYFQQDRTKEILEGEGSQKYVSLLSGGTMVYLTLP